MAKLLVVEDDRDQNLLTCLQLKRSGFSDIRSAYSGEDALRAIGADAPDIILLDIMLPDINGVDLLGQIRKECQIPATPIIALTGCTLDDEIAVMLQAGFNDVVTKPVEIPVLVEKINKQLARKTATRSPSA